MANAVIMPKAGITVESCIIGEWQKKVGDAVKVGDILFTYETDKASFECESTAEGTLLEIFYEEGDEVPCLVNVCGIGNPGEDCSALRGGSASSDAPAAYPMSPSSYWAALRGGAYAESFTVVTDNRSGSRHYRTYSISTSVVGVRIAIVKAP